jgi:hypothetical protein
MTLFEIVAFYVALSVLFNPYLMLRVGQGRFKNKINLGDGGNDDMIARIRAHGNFIEIAPLVLIGLIAMAMMGASPFMLHLVGASYFVGRILHFLGMSGIFGQGRFIGTLLTLLVFLTQGLYLLFLIFINGPA